SGATLPASLRTGATTEIAGLPCPLLCGMPQASKAHPDRVQPCEIPGFLRNTSRSAALIRLNEGQGKALRLIAENNSPRAAKARRTHSAPSAPTSAPAMTSLGWCASTTTRLNMMRSAKSHIPGRLFGHSAPIAIAADAAVVAWPDG